MTERKPMMSPFAAIKSCLRQYAGFSGRSPRAEFWWWVLGYGVVSIPIVILDGIIFGIEQDRPSVLHLLFSLAMLLPWLAVTTRRLHDLGRTGYWLLAWMAPGILMAILGVVVAVIVFGTLSSGFSWSTILWPVLIPYLALGVISVLWQIAGWIVWLFWMPKRGTAGPNRFGPDPLA